jgi:4-alpha-glucanotransferase
MDADGTLNRLGDAAGVESHYWDIHGTRHETSPDTMRALLRALGVSADTEVDVWSSLATLGEAPWRSALPPVVVTQEAEPVVLPVRLPMEEEHRTIRWSLRLESGALRTGECRLDTLPVEDMGHLGERRIALRRLKLGALPLGYHEFRVEAGGESVTRLIVAPARCHLPPLLTCRRCWGLAAQLYALKSLGDWGIGDFGDLKLLIERIAASDGDAIGLNPLHAMFLDAPEDASPYSPASRLFRNPLYLDVTAIPDFAECEEARALSREGDFQRALQTSRNAEFVNYRNVARLKLPVLEYLHGSFVSNHLESGDARAAAFRAFVENAGEELESFATFQALSERFQTHDWPRWPAACHDRNSAAVAELRGRYAERLSFFRYLQWQCDEQISSAAALARQRGMAIGLYNDLAVSVDAASADHWGHPRLFMGEARVGAPPDPFNEKGQDWGVVPLNPVRLRDGAYDYFARLLRANMRHAGALRIDHVMGWQRLFLIPKGAPPAAGAYVRYPISDLLAVAALESCRSRCLVIGEDLGTVPDGFREKLGGADVLSSRVFYFERQDGRFRNPREYPKMAAVSVSTHDLATLHGFWEGEDIAAKARLGLFKSSEEEAQAREARTAEKRELLQALADEDLLPQTVQPTLAWTPSLALAVHAFLARSQSVLFMVQLDDLTGQAHQANLPGSVTQYPNWRRRLMRPLEEVMADQAIQSGTAAVAAERAI